MASSTTVAKEMLHRQVSGEVQDGNPLSCQFWGDIPGS